MSLTFNITETKTMDNGSIEYWDYEDGTQVCVGDLRFYEPTLTWLVVDEITMEPVSGDPDELVYEPVFWCSPKDVCDQYHFSANEIKGLEKL